MARNIKKLPSVNCRSPPPHTFERGFNGSPADSVCSCFFASLRSHFSPRQTRKRQFLPKSAIGPPLPPRFSFSFLRFTLFLLILRLHSLPPLLLLLSSVLLLSFTVVFAEEEQEKKTALRFPSPPFVVFVSPYLLSSSSLTGLLGCVFLIFLLFPQLVLFACLLCEC